MRPSCPAECDNACRTVARDGTSILITFGNDVFGSAQTPPCTASALEVLGPHQGGGVKKIPTLLAPTRASPLRAARPNTPVVHSYFDANLAT
jgi:hypothetical protein